MTLMEYHTETGNERRQESYYGDTVGAWSGGYLRVLSELFPVRMMNSVYPENKRNPVRHISVALVCHRHLRDSPPSPCVLLCSRFPSSLPVSEGQKTFRQNNLQVRSKKLKQGISPPWRPRLTHFLYCQREGPACRIGKLQNECAADGKGLPSRDCCSQPVGNPVPSRRESCSQPPGTRFPALCPEQPVQLSDRDDAVH